MDRDSILGSVDFVTEAVAVPEWGGQVCVRVMSGRERDAFERRLIGSGKTDEVETQGLRAWLAVVCACDEQGQRIFRDEDLDAVQNKSSAVLERIAQAALRVNGLTPATAETIAKN